MMVISRSSRFLMLCVSCFCAPVAADENTVVSLLWDAMATEISAEETCKSLDGSPNKPSISARSPFKLCVFRQMKGKGIFKMAAFCREMARIGVSTGVAGEAHCRDAISASTTWARMICHPLIDKDMRMTPSVIQCLEESIR